MKQQVKYFINTKIPILKDCKCEIDPKAINQFIIGRRCVLCNGQRKISINSNN